MTTTMTRDEIQALATRFLEMWEQGDPQAFSAFYASDATVETPMFQKAVGREQIEHIYGETFRIFSRYLPPAPGLEPPVRWGDGLRGGCPA